jgi:hypothetical protein
VLGSRLPDTVARTGANFLTPEIARFVQRDVAYREIGALIDEERLWCNLLSSQPLCYNLFGPLKLDTELATRFFRELLPDFVAEVLDLAFEHSPGRGDPTFTADHSAFDAIAAVKTTTGKIGFIAFEVKYAENLASAPRPTNQRHDELARLSGVFRDLPEQPGAGLELILESSKYGYKAEAIELNGELTVLKGSRALAAGEFSTNGYAPLRDQLIIDKRLVPAPEPHLLLFTEDVPFANPSAAAAVIRNRNTNGRTSWRVKSTGQTLREWQDNQLSPGQG